MFCEGGHFVLVPSHCAQLFGSSKRGVQAFSVLFSCFGLSSLAGSLLNSYLQARHCDPYNKMFALSTLLTIIAKITLVYYDRLLEGSSSDSFETDDRFERVPTTPRGGSKAMEEMARVERKNLLVDMGPGFSDSDSQFSRTTRNTL